MQRYEGNDYRKDSEINELKHIRHTSGHIATAAAVAFVVFSCSDDNVKKEQLNFGEVPIQVVENMFYVDSENGVLKVRVEGGRMERYQTDSLSFELFPEGINVFSYNEEGKLESTITAQNARHTKFTKGESEVWLAYGNVVIKNILNQETMETDTLYWDRDKEKIHTDCYVRMYSPDGFMQGYGMVSDQKAKNSVILKPFNSYGIVEKDSTVVFVDSVNFIGPLQKK